MTWEVSNLCISFVHSSLVVVLCVNWGAGEGGGGGEGNGGFGGVQNLLALSPLERALFYLECSFIELP